MTGFGSLVGLFLRDLVRRRFVWILALFVLAFVALNYWVTGTLEDAIGQGEALNIATRRSAAQLGQMGATVRQLAPFAVIMFAAAVPPESRRNGTAQFVLSLGVRRDVLAWAEFVAAAIAIVIGTLVVHVGFCVPGLKTGAVTWADVGLAWPSLLLALLGVATAPFAWSLTASVFETYLVFIGVPVLARILPSVAQGFPNRFPRWLVRATDNLGLLFPDVTALVAWPRRSFESGAHFLWPTAHVVLALSTWVALGTYLHRRHDFGSRTALK